MMSKPFQFSMGQLLGAVTLFCLGLGEFGWLWKSGPNALIGILTFIVLALFWVDHLECKPADHSYLLRSEPS